MTDELKIMIDNDSLAMVIRKNLAGHLNKALTHELMNDLAKQIVESVEYFMNKKDDSKGN